MSEYQYYEFAAIDGPVTETEAEAPYVYSVSSRAEITPRRWRNVYNFGDFHGSPIRMMEHAELNRLVPPPVDVDSGRRRRMCELWEMANGLREERLRLQTEERDRERRKREAERKAHLESLITRADEVWREAEAMAELKKSSAYDQAAARIKDLRDAYALAGRSAEFQQRLETFRQEYARRPALLRRLSDLSPTDGALSQDDYRLA